MTQVTQSLTGLTGILRPLPLTLAEVQKFSKKVAAPELPGILLKGFYLRIHDQKLRPSQALADYFQPMSSATCASLLRCTTCSGLSAFCACAQGAPGSR